MKNKIITWKILIVIIIIWYLAYWILNLISLLNVEKSKTILLTEEKSQLTYQVEKQSTIEVIQENIRSSDLQKEINEWDIELLLKELKLQESIKRWELLYNRCLKIEAQLEIKWDDYNLYCVNYYNYYLKAFNEDAYKFLEKFTTRNINSTKIELGLY